MSLFGKKSPPPAPLPPSLPPPLPPTAVKPHSDDTVLKLNLPDVFAFDQDETRAKRSGKGKRSTPDADDRAGRGTIVLVETDEEVLRLMSRLLEHDGFTIFTASCLSEARTVVAEHHADFLLARRQSVPLNLQTEHVLRDLHSKVTVRVVDDFSELMLGQVIDYESIAQCTLSLTDLLMSLIEGGNVGARGHSHSVSKYCRLVGQRLGLSRRELDAVTVAGLLHDLGSLETHRKLGEGLYSRSELLPAAVRATLDILANTQFPFEINEIITTAADPNPGSDAPVARISRAAHILRVADAYDTVRRANTHAQWTEDQVFEELRRQPATTFDAQVLETFISMRKSEQAISAMNLFWAAVLIVDPNPDDMKLLQMRLENSDYHVEFAHTVEETLQKLRAQNFTLIVTEVKLDGRGDGFELLHSVRGDQEFRQIPVVFHSHAETNSVKFALEQGAEDWLPKPHNVEIMAMKIQRIIARRHSSGEATGAGGTGDGVRGSLREMGIMEMVQILSSGGRSVKIILEAGQRSGELTLQAGKIADAKCGDVTGETAAVDLLNWDEGQFRIVPLRQATPVVIRTSTDNLLLQACFIRDRNADADGRGIRP
jgi:response regulator RpfG family c-di-GMP phosphodiesterase